MIAILDYETARTDDLHQAMSRAGIAHERVDSQDKLDRAARIILPPGASFRDMIRDLRDGGYLPALFRAVGQGRPILGIAEGMHVLFDVSYEQGQHTGLGFIPGKVSDYPQPPPVHRGEGRGGAAVRGDTAGRAEPKGEQRAIHWQRPSPLLHGLSNGEAFYFEPIGSAEPLDPSMVLAQTNGASPLVALVHDGSVYGAQFLPERSGPAGERLLSNFANMPLR